MRRPTETALKSRARALLEAMTARGRFIYAVPRDDGPEAVRAIAAAEGLREVDGRWQNEKGTASIAVKDRPDLEVLIVEATGDDVPEILAKILDKAGFYAQSTLLGTAFDVADEEAPDALGTLAHMVVAWDDAWRELFALHLAASDPAVRRRAVESAMDARSTAGSAGPLPGLIEAAIRREKDEELKAAMSAAREALTTAASK